MSDFSFRDDDDDSTASTLRNNKHPHLPAWAKLNSPGKTAQDYLQSLTVDDIELHTSASSRNNRTPTQSQRERFRETFPAVSNSSSQTQKLTSTVYENREFADLCDDQEDTMYDNGDLLSYRSSSPQSPRHKRLVSSSSLVPLGQEDLIKTLRSSLSNISDQVTKLNEKVEKVLIVDQKQQVHSKDEHAASTIQKAWKSHVRRKSRPLTSPLPLPVSQSQTTMQSSTYADFSYVKKLEENLKLAVERVEALETHLMNETNERQALQTQFYELQSKVSLCYF